MSQADSDLPVEELLKQGKEAVRAGDKAAARALLEKVVSQDQNSEQGWFWLAAAVDDVNEKRTCLGNVLVINPGNERARRLLDQLQPAPVAGDERAALLTPDSGESSNRTLYIVAGVGAVLVLLVVVVLALGGRGGDKEAGPPPSNAGAGGNTPQSAAALPKPTNTLPPGVTPTASRTPQPPPPTWTPKPSMTPVSNLVPTVFPPPPSSLAGQLIMRSGQVISDPNNQPIVVIKPDGSGERPLMTGSARGHAPVLSPDGTRFAYINFSPATNEVLLEIDNLQGTAPISASVYWGGGVPLFRLDTPAWSPDGNWIAFVAQPGGAVTADLFRVSLANPDGSNPAALEHLTNDDAAESWPAWSPDGQQIVYAADLSMVSPGGSTDLRIYHVADGQITDLTNDGAALIESAPDWSPDGQWIVFQSKESGGTGTDIYRMTVGGTPEKIIDSDANDIQPRFSPDGQYLVFSSDRSGNWDVYVYEIATQSIYQVTTSPYVDIANDWGR
jgi:Tol biopolymer transport system component